jgi:hypothetical protein
MKKTKDKKEYRRAQAVLKKGEGKIHKTITKVTGILDNKSFSYAISSHMYETSLPLWHLGNVVECVTVDKRFVLGHLIFL